MSPSPQTPRKPDPLELAFCEYAIQTWDERDWRRFGRETGTSDIIADDPRLYRSLNFNDDDYDEAVYRVAPKVIHEALGPQDGPHERMQLLADYAPDMASWVVTYASGRSKRNFCQFLERQHESHIPSEWRELFNPLIGASPQERPVTLSPKPSDSPFAEPVSVPNPASAQIKPSSQPRALVNTTKHSSSFYTEVKPAQHERSETWMPATRSIFIVHGHDHVAVNSVKVFVYDITGIMPTTLTDSPGKGNTLIEKFEREATSANYAIVLLTPDDEGRVRLQDKNEESTNALNPRARQNVILELGYFFGKLGREHVAVLNAGVEQPSDVHGVQYIPYPGSEWKEDLRRELGAANLLKRQ